MSIQTKSLPFALSGLLVATTAMGAGQNGNQGSMATWSQPDELETQTLVYMREEEKVARDVYSQMDALWGDDSLVRVFALISDSEQAHMDAIGRMLDKYGIADPIGDDAVGVFANEDLKALYDTLLGLGDDSYVDALQVGCVIEEVDILDLKDAIAELEGDTGETDNLDLKRVYENLLHGSENHLRAFVGALAAENETYENQYLTDEEFAAILEGSNQGGRGNGSGKGGSRGGRS